MHQPLLHPLPTADAGRQANRAHWAEPKRPSAIQIRPDSGRGRRPRLPHPNHTAAQPGTRCGGDAGRGGRVVTGEAIASRVRKSDERGRGSGGGRKGQTSQPA
eukprot:364841-Chlamydomonas_euryale.AAC.8